MSLDSRGAGVGALRVARRLVAPSMTGLAIVQPLAVLGARHSWLLDALTHLRTLGIVLLLLAALCWAVTKRWPFAPPLVLWAAFQAMPIFQFDGPNPVRASEAAEPVRIMVANVLTTNRNFAALAELIRREKPDIVGLVELTPDWVSGLEAEGVRAEYPHRVELPGGARGIGVWSRISPHRLEPPQVYSTYGHPVLKLSIPFGDGLTTVWIVHTPNPIGPARSWANQDLLALAEQIGLRGGSQIVIGDLNRTESSPYYGDFLRATGLRDSRFGFGRQPTWPAHIFYRIPIDHAFVSADVAVVDRRMGPNIGSDHLPLIVDLAPAEPTKSRK